MVKIPSLHFGKVVRRRIKEGTKFFNGGTFAELDEFLPQKFSKRQATSTVASIYDPRGKLAPLIAAAKQLLWLTTSKTIGWDDPMPHLSRNKWVKMFWKFKLHRALHFTRPVMPVLYCIVFRIFLLYYNNNICGVWRSM